MPSPPSPRTAPTRGLNGLIRGLAGRLRPVAGAPGSGGGRNGLRPEDPLLAVGQRLQQARQARGLGLRQLADETRISTPVLEALERGWRDRLPEAAYLRTMLPLLEEHLQLEAGALDGALPRDAAGARLGVRGGPTVRRFTPGSIDVFTSWEGTLVYGLLTLGLLLALNRQQQALVQLGRVEVGPLPLAPTQAPAATRQQAFPELHPLARAAAGQALPQLRQDSRRPGPDLSLGRLELQLAGPTSVSLHSRDGFSRLQAAGGELRLPVLPPFRLELKPAPSTADAVRWNGRTLVGGDGRYRYPAAEPARPRRAAISP